MARFSIGAWRDGYRDISVHAIMTIAPYDYCRDSVAQAFGSGDPDVVALKIDAENVVVRRRGVTGIVRDVPCASRTSISGFPCRATGR